MSEITYCGCREFTYTLDQVRQATKSYIDNGNSIASAFPVVTDFIWPDPNDAVDVVRILEEIDHLRRGETVGRLFTIEWCNVLKELFK